MELYWAYGSIASWRIALALLFKGLEVEDRLLDLGRREHLQLGYTSLNPRGRVPTLVDGDLVITEPLAILAYLERAYPRPPLFGGDAAEGARIWEQMLVIDTYVAPPLLKIARTLSTRPLQDPIRIGELKEKVADLLAELDRLESFAERGPFNAVDATLVPLLALLQRSTRREGADKIGLLPFDWKRYTRLMERYEAVRALEGFGRTWPPHWA